ncbi:sodium-dependent phosphate transport protein 2B-like [Lytechinus variegatus]|uniref:sodium-dependent phosphate transport protein 2B-like n=1 Tax=Lytechinus variegatus TaxID=7654 RepID=UPI001BB0F045|nr:sodium-dependent phosphate transport protein 2B-like [Lytechinus variegatus]
MGTKHKGTFNHFFAHTTLSDIQVGFIVLSISLFGVACTLILMVKLLNSFLESSITRLLRRFVNADFPNYMGFLSGYIAILIGTVCTFFLQSSSIFTSLLTPLVGMDVLSIDRVYPLTLGSNIGTTITGIISALASNGGELEDTLHIALCHFFFNVTGILIWYPLPLLRRVPVTLANSLGNKTSKHRWFAVLYVAVMFLILPGAVFGMSVAGDPYLFGIGLPLLVLVAAVILINIAQHKAPQLLPTKLKTWECLPAWMHSLKPFDNMCVCVCLNETNPSREFHASA